MSNGAERPGPLELPGAWDRLERAAEDAAVATALWRRRAREAEAQVVELRRALEEVASQAKAPDGSDAELLRLRAENAALHSRMRQARKRIEALMTRLGAMEKRP